MTRLIEEFTSFFVDVFPATDDIAIHQQGDIKGQGLPHKSSDNLRHARDQAAPRIPYRTYLTYQTYRIRLQISGVRLFSFWS